LVHPLDRQDISKPPAMRLIASAVVALIAAVISIRQIGPLMELERRQNNALYACGTEVIKVAPVGSVIIADWSEVARYFQFLRPYRIYDTQVFSPAWIAGLASEESNEGDPQSLDPQRSKVLRARLGNMTQVDLTNAQRAIIIAALNKGRRVFLLTAGIGGGDVARRIGQIDFQCNLLATNHPEADTLEINVMKKTKERWIVDPQSLPKVRHWNLVEVTFRRGA